MIDLIARSSFMKSLVAAFAVLAASTHSVAQQPGDVVTERISYVDPWNVTLIEREYCKPDSDVCQVELLITDGEGKRRSLAKGLQGRFVPLKRARKIFSCEDNTILSVPKPLLIDLDGAKQELPDHPGHLQNCSAVGTGEEVLLVYVMLDAEGLYTLSRVLASTGKTLAEKRLRAAGSIEFTVEGKVHRAAVPAPQYPG